MRIQSQEHWLSEKLLSFPWQWMPRIAEKHLEMGGADRVENQWILGLSEKVSRLRVPIDMDDSDLRAMAIRCASDAMALATGPLITGIESFRERLEGYCIGYGIKPPERQRVTRKGGVAGVADGPAVRRMTCPLWWRRALRKAQARQLEGVAIELGYVSRVGEVYASDVTVERRARQKQANAAALADTEAINLDTGEVFGLDELVGHSIANPAIRRGELMLRVRGFEEVANAMGHAAEFWTATCPSRMHCKKVVGGEILDNLKYDGTTPRDAQKHLTKTWARFRAAAHRRGLSFYGFRVAEPHHDATPHWHLLLFVPRSLSAGRSAIGRLRALFRRYFLAVDSGECGAKKHRVDFVSIDPAKGSAAGYLAFYVSKNIDGYQVQGDFEAGCAAVTGSQRVEAWASTWGIRQFQQVGGPPVGVWRELRRMRDESPEYSPEVEDQRAAADAGNWKRYVELQGGPVVRRDDLPLRVAYTGEGERWCDSMGAAVPAPQTRYGEAAKPAVFGVRDMRRNRAHVSRFFLWEIRRAGNVGSVGRVRCCGVRGGLQDRLDSGEKGGSGAFVKGFGKAEDHSFVSGSVFSTVDADGYPLGFFGVFWGWALWSAWTRANNCTRKGMEYGNVIRTGECVGTGAGSEIPNVRHVGENAGSPAGGSGDFRTAKSIDLRSSS